MKIYKPHHSKTVLYVSGGWGYGNRGDNAILAATLSSLRERFPDAEVVLTSYSQEEIEANHGLKSEPSLHALLFKQSWRSACRRLSLRLWELSRRFPLAPSLARHLALIKRSDAVILAGGGYFNDIWDEMKKAQYALIRLAGHAGTPIVIYGQTVGPFSTASIDGELKAHLALVDRIACRDEPSLAIVRRAGVPEEKTVLTADEANLLPVLCNTAQRSAPDGRIVAGIVVQHYRPHRDRHGATQSGRIDSASYLSTIVDILRAFSKSVPVRYRLIASTAKTESLAAQLARLLAQEGLEFEVLRNPHVLGYVEACQSVDIMISTNMHPIILATTNHKPSLAFSYDMKLDHYMQAIGMGDFVERIDDFSQPSVLAKLERLWRERDALSARLAERKAEVDILARKNAETLLSLFERPRNTG